MDTGTIISGAGHGLLLAFLAMGGLFEPEIEPLDLQATDVSIISSEDFAALTRPEETPPVPEPVPDVEPEPEQIAEPEPVPEPEPPAPEPEPEPPAPAPEPEPPAPEPEPPAPEEAPLAEETVLEETPLIAPIPVPEASDAPEVSDVPTPRVDEEANTDVTAEEEPPAAPDQATTEVVIEPEIQPSRAPLASLVPISRPRPPLIEPEPEAEPDPETPAAEPQPEVAEETPEIDTNSAVTDALAGGTPNDGPTGPPLSFGEKDAFRVAVGACWNRGALSSAADRTTVLVGFSMNPDGTPDASTIRMIRSEGGDDIAARIAFEAASRAIRRCGARGFDLPPEKYNQWREVEIIFRADGPRIE